jgi:hypothetical protein
MENESYEGDQTGLYGLDENFDTGLDTGSSSSDFSSTDLGSGGSDRSVDPFKNFKPGRNKPSNPLSATQGETDRYLRNIDLESEKAKIKIQSPDLFDDVRKRLSTGGGSSNLPGSPSSVAEQLQETLRTQPNNAMAILALKDSLTALSKSGDGGSGGKTSSAPMTSTSTFTKGAPGLNLPFNVVMPVPGSGVKKNYYEAVRDLLNAMSHYK